MSTTSSYTVRLVKPSAIRQTKAVAQHVNPQRFMVSWDDAVTVVSLTVLVATILFLAVVG